MKNKPKDKRQKNEEAAPIKVVDKKILLVYSIYFGSIRRETVGNLIVTIGKLHIEKRLKSSMKVSIGNKCPEKQLDDGHHFDTH